MSNFNQSFADTLRTLNAEQAQAVKHIDGPVLVVAGPGTGKTHILSARIGHILTETDTAPYNILCLTFTDAGVQAMRERLLKLIGPEAHKVHIFTFHSFCNKVIQDNLDLFSRQDLALLDDLERQEIIRGVIDELPHDHPLKKGRGSDIYFYEKHLADLFKIMKTEAWAIDFVEKNVQNYLKSLPQRTEYIYQNNKKGVWVKGDLKTEKLEQEQQKMERLSAAVALYPRFEQILKELRRYDFDDMILWVIDAFDKFQFLLRNYQEQYLYFLVDEYQDTNGSQNKILTQLIGFWENPNIFIVGDDDQAIYEFQGARLKSLVDFYRQYQNELKVILLKENYRSSQSILDVSKKLIDLNNLRIINQLQHLNIEKTLISKGSFKQPTALPEVIEYPNRLHEIADIVYQIEKLQAQGTPLSQIAIIYARHREVENIIALLDKKGIPYQTKRRINILDTPMIQNLRLILGYIEKENETPFSADYLLFKILNINFLDIAQADILKIAVHIHQENAKNNRTEADDLVDYEIKTTWRNTLSNLPKLSFNNIKKIKNTVVLLEKWIQNVQNQSLLTLIEQIINQSGVLNWAVKSPNKVWNVQVLNTFFDFIKAETEKKPRMDIRQLLRMLEVLDKNRISVELVQNITHSNAISGGGGLVLTTAHSAKGLEFEHVFLMDTVETEWESTKMGANNRFKLPDTLTYTTEENAIEARRRLFYVAMTRAKEHLHISYARVDEKNKPLSKTQFIDEILIPYETSQAAAIHFENRIVNEDILIQNQITVLSENTQVDFEIIEKEWITQFLKDFKLSVSALHAYLDCPLSFYFEYILKIPTAPSEASRFGSAVHYALRKLFGDMLRSKDKQFPSCDEFVKFFEIDLQRQRSHYKENDFQRRIAMGRDNLRRFYAQNIDKWSKNVVIEKQYLSESDGVPLKGVIDKIEYRDDGTAHIVDYKTGKYDTTRLSRPTVKNPNGGSYWRQLVFYKVLYENYRSQLIRVKSGEISYLEPDTKGVFKSKILDIDSKDVEILRGLISTSWERIQAFDFKGCGKKECNWCRFIKNNQTIDSFTNIETEYLDDM
jgi:DNA helicase II / ATP-dependent DNA helicase PcrA